MKKMIYFCLLISFSAQSQFTQKSYESKTIIEMLNNSIAITLVEQDSATYYAFSAQDSRYNHLRRIELFATFSTFDELYRFFVDMYRTFDTAKDGESFEVQGLNIYYDKILGSQVLYLRKQGELAYVSIHKNTATKLIKKIQNYHNGQVYEK